MTAETSQGPHPCGCEPWFRGYALSGGNDVLGLRALLALGDVEGDLLALAQLTVTALGADGGVVREDVGAAAVLLDEAEALFRVEPLNGARSHVDLLLDRCKTETRTVRIPRRRVRPTPGDDRQTKMHPKI